MQTLQVGGLCAVRRHKPTQDCHGSFTITCPNKLQASGAISNSHHRKPQAPQRIPRAPGCHWDGGTQQPPQCPHHQPTPAVCSRGTHSPRSPMWQTAHVQSGSPGGWPRQHQAQWSGAACAPSSSTHTACCRTGQGSHHSSRLQGRQLS